MKKMIMMAVAACLSWTVSAQTDFRSLSHDEAMAAAKQEGKLVFIDFYTSWCGPCKMMARDVFPQKEVGDYFNAHFVCVKLDAEKEAEGKPYVKTYKVAAFPTFVVVDPKDGSVLYNKAGGNFNGKAFVEQIRVGITPDLSPARMTERYASGERTAQLISAYANSKVEEASHTRDAGQRMEKMAEAVGIIDSYWDTLSDEQRLSADNAFCYNVAFLGKAPKGAKVDYIIRNKERFTGDMRTEVSQQIELFADNLVTDYLSGAVKYTPEEARDMHTFIVDNGLNVKDRYTAAFRLIETYADGDESRYLDVCEKNFAKMDEAQKQSVLMSFSELITGNDKALIQRADKFMRKQFLTVDATTIYFASVALIQFQKRLDGEEGKH